MAMSKLAVAATRDAAAEVGLGQLRIQVNGMREIRNPLFALALVAIGQPAAIIGVGKLRIETDRVRVGDDGQSQLLPRGQRVAFLERLFCRGRGRPGAVAAADTAATPISRPIAKRFCIVIFAFRSMGGRLASRPDCRGGPRKRSLAARQLARVVGVPAPTAGAARTAL